MALTNNASRNAGIFSSSQPICRTEDRSLQSEPPSSNAPISHQTQASIGSFIYEEAMSVLGRPDFNSSSLDPGNSFSEQVNENDCQANIADSAISENVEEKMISVGARSYEEGSMGEPSIHDNRSWVWTRFLAIAMPGKM